MRDAVPFDYDRPGPFIVFLTPAGEQYPVPVEKTVEANIGTHRGKLRLEPDFFVVPLGATLLFKNADDQQHNLFSSAMSVKSFNVIVPARGSRSIMCRKVGPVFIRSLDSEIFDATFFIGSPYSAVTDEKGNYQLQAPPGAYRADVWHPRLPPESKEVVLADGQTVEANFTLSVNALPQIE
jgi:hypothetical protein